MHIRRGGTLKASRGTADKLNVYRHLMKVDEVIEIEDELQDVEDIYDPEREDIYDVVEE